MTRLVAQLAVVVQGIVLLLLLLLLAGGAFGEPLRRFVIALTLVYLAAALVAVTRGTGRHG